MARRLSPLHGKSTVGVEDIQFRPAPARAAINDEVGPTRTGLGREDQAVQIASQDVVSHIPGWRFGTATESLCAPLHVEIRPDRVPDIRIEPAAEIRYTQLVNEKRTDRSGREPGIILLIF